MPRSYNELIPKSFEPKSRVIAVANQKGGVGKTTSSYNIAAARAQAGEYTLMIDLDPQYNLTECCAMMPDDPATNNMDVCKLFSENVDPFDCCFSVDAVNSDKLFIVPGTQRLAITCENIVKHPEYMLVFKRNIKKLSEVFLTIVIDCPPQLDKLLTSALISATEVVIPVKPDRLSSKSLDLIIPTIEDVRNAAGEVNNKNLVIAGLIVNMFRTTVKEHKEVYEKLLDEYEILGVVPLSTMVTKEFERGLPVVIAHGSSAPAKIYKEISAKL